MYLLQSYLSRHPQSHVTDIFSQTMPLTRSHQVEDMLQFRLSKQASDIEKKLLELAQNDPTQVSLFKVNK